MKHIRLLFVVAFLSISGQLFAQKVTVAFQNIKLESVINEIAKQTGYVFSYTEPTVDTAINVSLKAKEEDLPAVLERLFAQTNIDYNISGKNIYLREKQQPSRLSSSHKIQGIVTDAAGNPVIGAVVLIKGTTQGTSTSKEGTFSLNAKSSDILLVSYIGCVTQSIPVHNQKQIQVSMENETKAIDEVVVVGYGTAMRKNIIGAVDQVSGKIMEDRSIANVAQALQGASANLIIQQTKTDPGESQVNINIRGVSTLGNNSPLIVIDGIISNLDEMNALNPLDIDKVSILKDAGSAAIYGSRSANGVILITTKRGRLNEKVNVQLIGSYGMQAPIFTYEPAHGYENAILMNMANYNSGLKLSFKPEEIQKFRNDGDSEWYLKQLLKSAPQQNYGISISGGNDKTSYLISLGYMDQKSNFVGGKFGFKRYNFRNSVSTEVGRFKLSSILGFSRSDGLNHSYDHYNMIGDAARIPLYSGLEMKNANGKYMLNNMQSQANSLGMLEKGGKQEIDQNNVSLNFDAEMKIVEGLKLKGVVGANIQSYHRLITRKPVEFYLDPESESPASIANPMSEVGDYNQYSVSVNSQLLLDYNRTFAKSHTVTGLVGMSNEWITRKMNEIIQIDVDPDLSVPTSDSEISKNSYNTPQRTNQQSIQSYFGRVGYSYNELYFVEATFRVDGSSKFAPDRRWGVFPSVSAGWRISNEKFMNSYAQKVGDLKLRSSYGILGNQNVDDYRYKNTYTLQNAIYAFNNQTVSGANYSVGNPYFSWEKSSTFDVGVDMNFFKNKLSISFDYYNKLTSGILLNPVVPSTFGASLPPYNAGKVRNWGWETTVNYYLTTGKVNHSFSLNIGDSQNKVIKYGDTNIYPIAELFLIIQEGLPINSFYGYKRDGYFQTQEELANGPFFETGGAGLSVGDVRYKDIHKDGNITPEDRVVLGNAFPRYTFGLTYGLEWKGFDLSMLFQGVGKRTLAIRGELAEPFHHNWSYAIFKHQLDFWTPDNRDARYPRLSNTGSASNLNNYQVASDTYLYDGAYLRLKNATIGYTLPSKLVSKLGIQKLRVYVNAENIFTISKVKFIDPEYTSMDSNMSGGLGSGRMYPNLRYIGGGIELKF